MDLHAIQKLLDVTPAVLDFARAGGCSRSNTQQRKGRMQLYFIGSGDAVKIGKAKCSQARLQTLQTGSKDTLVLLASIECAGHMEGDIHKRLSHLRIRGEWFRYTDEVHELIGSLRNV